MNKKVYMIPCTIVVKVAPMRLIADSLNMGSGDFDPESMKYVKENNISGRSNYNVWSDDWSE